MAKNLIRKCCSKLSGRRQDVETSSVSDVSLVSQNHLSDFFNESSQHSQKTQEAANVRFPFSSPSGTSSYSCGTDKTDSPTSTTNPTYVTSNSSCSSHLSSTSTVVATPSSTAVVANQSSTTKARTSVCVRELVNIFENGLELLNELKSANKDKSRSLPKPEDEDEEVDEEETSSEDEPQVNPTYRGLDRFPFRFHRKFDLQQGIKLLQSRIGYTFNNENLLLEAMSPATWRRSAQVGDSISRTILADQWVRGTTFACTVHNFQQDIFDKILSDRALGKRARQLGLYDFVLWETPVRQTHYNDLATMIEAILGAVYRDSGSKWQQVFQVMLNLDIHIRGATSTAKGRDFIVDGLLQEHTRLANANTAEHC